MRSPERERIEYFFKVWRQNPPWGTRHRDKLYAKKGMCQTGAGEFFPDVIFVQQFPFWIFVRVIVNSDILFANRCGEQSLVSLAPR